MISQFQRSAIESLEKHLKPITIYPGELFLINHTQVFLIGVSFRRGVKYAVFGDIYNDFALSQSVDVSGCVFLRDLTKKERAGRKECLRVVEAIVPGPVQRRLSNLLIFKKKGAKAEYPFCI